MHSALKPIAQFRLWSIASNRICGAIRTIGKKDELIEWATSKAKESHQSLTTLRAKFDSLGSSKHRQRADLFIQIASHDSQSLQWWLEDPLETIGTSPKQIDFEKGGIVSALETYLPEILNDALGILGEEHELRIGFLVPPELCIVGLEDIRVEGGEKLGLMFRVLFHWVKPFIHPARGNQIRYTRKSLLGLIRDQKDGVRLHWVAPKFNRDDDEKLLAAAKYDMVKKDMGTCLGLEHPVGESKEKLSASILRSLECGIPCMLWIQTSDVAGECPAIKQQLADSFTEFDPSNAPLEVLHRHSIAVLGLGMVWDSPDYLPKRTSVQDKFGDK